MTHKDGTESENDDAQTQMVAQESVPIEEVKMLRQQMTKIYEAWMNRQAPMPSIREYLNVNMHSSSKCQQVTRFIHLGLDPTLTHLILPELPQ